MKAKFEVAKEKVIAARKTLVDAKEYAISSKEKLRDQEASLILNGLVTGGNEMARSASMRSQTIEWREKLFLDEQNERIAALELDVALDERRCLESILKIEELSKW